MALEPASIRTKHPESMVHPGSRVNPRNMPESNKVGPPALAPARTQALEHLNVLSTCLLALFCNLI